MWQVEKEAELEDVRLRYERRKNSQLADKYSIFRPAIYMAVQERERALIDLFKSCKLLPIAEKKLLEIGCGGGGNLLQLLQFGFSPQNLVGNELLKHRVEAARKRLPAEIQLIPGDASSLDLPENSFDIVYQSVVFSSILDDEFQQELANKMYKLAKKGGGILWYDFIYDNPSNPDVRGVSIKRIRTLFPQGKITVHKVTLAPPISRVVTKIHPNAYHIFNMFPFLRTHVLCWIEKA